MHKSVELHIPPKFLMRYGQEMKGHQNSIVYNAALTQSAVYPYSVIAAGQSRFTQTDPQVDTLFNEQTLLLTRQGTGRINAEGQTVLATSGMLSWVDSSRTYSHGCATGADAWDYLWVSFASQGADQLYQQLVRQRQLHVHAPPQTELLFREIARDLSENHPGRHAQFNGLIAQILALFENSPRQAKAQTSLADLVDAMSQDLAAAWSTQAMAEYAGMSVSRFHHRFREEFGAPPATWLREKRLSAAKQLLTETDLDVADVGAACGYPEPHHFSREFTKNVLLPPSKFRRHMKARVAR